MSRILLEALERLIGKPLDFKREAPIRGPELRRGVMSQRGVVLPEEWSRSASWANRSSLPALISASIWRSQAAQSNSRNQARSVASSSGESASICRSMFSTLPHVGCPDG